MMIVEVYFKLLKLIEDIDYYKKYPTRIYLQGLIDRELTIEGKVRTILNDGLIQREVFSNWVGLGHKVDDPLAYYLKLHEAKH